VAPPLSKSVVTVSVILSDPIKLHNYKRDAKYTACSAVVVSPENLAQTAMARPGTLYIAAATVAVLITQGNAV